MASPYTPTFFLPDMSTSHPYISTGKEIEIVAVPSVAFKGPSKGYSIVCPNTGYIDIRIFFTFSAVTETSFSPAGK